MASAGYKYGRGEISGEETNMNFNIKACLMLFKFGGLTPQRRTTMVELLVFLYSNCYIVSLMILGVVLVFKESSLASLEVPKAFSTFFICCHGFMKSVTLFVKKPVVFALLDDMNSKFWPIDSNPRPNERKNHYETLRDLKNQFLVFTLLCSVSILPRVITPFLMKESYVPFTCYQPEWINDVGMSFYQIMVMLQGLFMPVFGADMFILALITLTHVQFKLLGQELKRIFCDRKNFDKNLKRCIEHHNFLLEFGNRINDLFSMTILLYLLIVILSMCFEMYLASILRSPIYFIQTLCYFLTVTYMFCRCYCFPSQILMDEAANIHNCVYATDWYNFPEKSRALLTIIIRSQKSLYISAGGFVRVDLPTCLNTVQTIVSYCMFLRTMGIQ